MYIKDEIEYLLKLIKTPPKEASTTLFYRMHVWGIIAEFNRVNHELERISSDLDTNLNLEVARFNFEKYLKEANLNERDFNDRLLKCWGRDSNQNEINRMTNYLPNGNSNYNVTSDVISSVKGAMHQLCDEDRISSRVLIYALNDGFKTMMRLLKEIQEKVSDPEPYLYKRFWDENVANHIDDESEKQFKRWVQNVGKPTLDDLKTKQKQEIFNFLTRDFFRFCNIPSTSAVKKRKLKITEEDLEYGTQIPADFDKECALLEKYFTLEEGCIAVLDYEKLGQYIYRHYNELDEEELFVITGFDLTMDLINEKMAQLKPGLAKYTKRYQEHLNEELLKDCQQIFEPFKVLLKDELRKTLIDEYLELLLLHSTLEVEARKKMSGQSRNKYSVSIVRALSDSFIFKSEYNDTHFANVLTKSLQLESNDTIQRYFREADTRNAPLTKWTHQIIDELKKGSNIFTKNGLFVDIV